MRKMHYCSIKILCKSFSMKFVHDWCVDMFSPCIILCISGELDSYLSAHCSEFPPVTGSVGSGSGSVSSVSGAPGSQGSHCPSANMSSGKLLDVRKEDPYLGITLKMFLTENYKCGKFSM